MIMYNKYPNNIKILSQNDNDTNLTPKLPMVFVTGELYKESVPL